jgi:D-alanine transaminase
VKTAYLNGQYVPLSDARVSALDRGFVFSDGIYEVWGARGGRLMDWEGHIKRMHRSLGELRIRPPMSDGALGVVIHELIRRNRFRDGLVYLQITRGAAPRDHAFPGADVSPTLFLFAAPAKLAAIDKRAASGVAVITHPDIRWGRCDIKTVGLLPNVLAKQAAVERGAYEAWLFDADGMITEGSSTNAWIVDASGRLRTRPEEDNILRGVTRMGVIASLPAGLEVAYDGFSVEEAKSAREAFQTSASGPIMPVVSIDGVTVGDGRPGPVTMQIREAYLATAFDR